MKKVSLCTFYTSGGNDDKGIPLEDLYKNFYQEYNSFFDQIIGKSPKILVKEDSVYKNLIKDYSLLKDFYYQNNYKINDYWLKIGMLSWKPRFIYDCLKSINDDEILLYHDINYLKYPQYLNGIAEWSLLLNKYHKKKDICLFRDSYKPLLLDCKSILIDGIKTNNYINKKYLPGFWAGMISFKKTKESLLFLERWMDITENINNVAPHPDYDLKTRNKGYIWHAHDQSTLAVCYYNMTFKKRKNINIKIVTNRSFEIINIKQKIYNAINFYLDYLFCIYRNS